jgi:hypothetical protein
MARGSKKKYTSKQKRKASKIERGYKKRGVSSKEAERRAWATVNKADKGGRKKAEEAAGKSAANQVLVKGKKERPEIRPAEFLYNEHCDSSDEHDSRRQSDDDAR